MQKTIFMLSALFFTLCIVVGFYFDASIPAPVGYFPGLFELFMILGIIVFIPQMNYALALSTRKAATRRDMIISICLSGVFLLAAIILQIRFAPPIPGPYIFTFAANIINLGLIIFLSQLGVHLRFKHLRKLQQKL